MATFYTITQKGFNFTLHEADKLKKDEEWSIERVAAFMSVHHVLNIEATKYAKGMTYRPAVAAIQYTLKCDEATSADINKLTKYLVPKLCAMYDDQDRQGFLGKPLSTLLDEIEIMANEFVQEHQAPIEVFGKLVTPSPFYSRPTRLEYDSIEADHQAFEQSLWDKYREVLNSGNAAGHRIKMREGSNLYTCVITRVSDKCVYCDVKDEFGRTLQTGARFPKESKRFLIDTFR